MLHLSQCMCRSMPASDGNMRWYVPACRSYEDLDNILARAHGGDTFAAEKAFDAMQYTISSAASFQTMIERCLGLPASVG